MRPLFTMTSFIIIAPLLSACADTQASSSFEACESALGAKRASFCSCVYDALKDDFSDTQMTRIGGLFQSNINQASKDLKASGSQSDLDILNRINTVEGATETCAKAMKS